MVRWLRVPLVATGAMIHPRANEAPPAIISVYLGSHSKGSTSRFSNGANHQFGFLAG